MNKPYIKIVLASLIFTTIIFAQKPETELKFKPDGTFKIVQFTDIHWHNDSANKDTLVQVITNVLETERPDLVMLTGDIITAKSTELGWKTLTQIFIDNKIPWAATLGNHDDESDFSRQQIIELLHPLPYSVVKAGPQDLGSSGNYVLEIKSKDKTSAVLYCMDSRAYSTLKGIDGYGWFSFDQVNWFREKSALYKTTPSLAFFHIPFPEYNEVWDSPDSTCIGIKQEKVCCPAINTGMFAAMRETGNVMGVFVGHDHDNDYIGCLHNIALAYGRVTGFDSYGNLPRGGRVIELLENKREFNSWIRTSHGDVLNKVNYPNSFRK